MSEPKKPRRGLLVEDTTVAGGVTSSGKSVVTPKGPDGKVDESVKATDPSENRRKTKP